MGTGLRIALVANQSLAYCRRVMRGVKRFAEERPDWILLPVAATPADVQRLHRLDVSGVIAHVWNHRLFQAMKPWHKRLVNISWVLFDLPLPSVGTDNDLVGKLAAQHFLERGFRNFGFVGHRNHAYSVLREASFRQTIEAAGYRVLAHYAKSNERFDPMGHLWALDPRLQRWVAQLPKPAAIFSPNDIWGLQLTELARQAGLRVPEELALLGVDDDDLLCEMARPSLSSVALASEWIGREAAALLDRLLAGNRPPTQPILLPPVGVSLRQSSEVLAVHDREVVTAVAFIRANVHRPLRVDDVIRGSAHGRRTLEHRFHATLGWGIAAQIRHEKIQRAKHLLLRTDLSMDQIADQSGFSDQFRFSAVFRKLAGIPPSTYRRSFANGAARRAKG